MAIMSLEDKNYYDLTGAQNATDALRIRVVDRFNCLLENRTTNETYRGFVLARTKKGNRLTMCDVDFQRSSKDGKYHPRLTFRKAFVDHNDVPVQKSAAHVRIPLRSTEDGRVAFWKMISFLHKFKEIVDLGSFDRTFHALTSEDLERLFSDSENLQTIKDTLSNQDIDLSELLQIRPVLNTRLLKSLRDKLQEFVDSNASEADVQAWIDKDNKKYRQQRCLIFGLEYIDFRREGLFSSKRVDILTSIGVKGEHHALIELKSPRDDIFSYTQRDTEHAEVLSYSIHPQLARAIPQILEYKKLIEDKEAYDPDLRRLGFEKRPRISKCMIIIGKSKGEDEEWRQHRQNLSEALGSGLEILTYTDLLARLEATIHNLEKLLTSEGESDAVSESEGEDDLNPEDIPF